MNYIKAFIAGFMSTIIFHQGLLFLLNLIGMASVPPFNTQASSPFGVPGFLSLAFFGGLWGILLWLFIAGDRPDKYWAKSFIFGAVAPTLVAVLIVAPLKGNEFSAARLALGIILNGAWGLGTAWILKKLKFRNRKFLPA